MRFLVDECTGPGAARWLIQREFDVYSVYDQSPGIDDEQVLTKAVSEDRILITNDKDFGDMVYRDQRPHRGIILLRLQDPRTTAKIAVLQHLLEEHADLLANAFVVATENTLRINPG